MHRPRDGGAGARHTTGDDAELARVVREKLHDRFRTSTDELAEQKLTESEEKLNFYRKLSEIQDGDHQEI